MPDHVKVNEDTLCILWRLWGPWTSEEINAIEPCLEKYIIRSSFSWYIKKDDNGFTAIRSILNDPLIKGEDVTALIENIDRYYRDNKD